MIIRESPNTTCWYHQGMSAENIPLALPGIWTIVVIDKEIRDLTPSLLFFIALCKRWHQVLKYARDPRNLCKREVGLGSGLGFGELATVEAMCA